METQQYLLDKLFSKDLEWEQRENMLDVIFEKFILPNINSFIPVKEETFFKYRKSGIQKTKRWYDKNSNPMYITLCNKGPWFLITYPPNSNEYGIENPDPNLYYEIPNFAQAVNPILLQERELF